MRCVCIDDVGGRARDKHEYMQERACRLASMGTAGQDEEQLV